MRLTTRFFLTSILLAALAVPLCSAPGAGGSTPLSSPSVNEVSPPVTVTHFVGSFGGPGSEDGTGSAARFNAPIGAATDAAGIVYVADYYNHTIRKVTPGGVVTTLAGLAGAFGSADGTGSAARFFNPMGVATDTAGNVYVGDNGNHTIRSVTPGGVVTTLAGLAGAFGSADGTGSAARFNNPEGVATDTAGNVYVADYLNHTIRKMTSGGVVTTLAGLAGAFGSADGTGSAARFQRPSGVATDSAGNVYVADFENHTIRRVTPGGVVTTVAGLAGSFGSADGTGSAARFFFPSGVATDTAGNVYVADQQNHTIRKVTPAGVVTTLAGLAGSIGSADGTGSAARFNDPFGVATDSAGNVYVADAANVTIRKVTPGGVVTTLAGLAASFGSADGTGSAARFYGPERVGADSAGNVYVGDGLNHTIRKVTAGGVVTTLAGLAGSSGSTDGTGSAARFDTPSGVAADTAGNVYVADNGNRTIRKVTPGGVVTTLAGLAGSCGSANGTGNAARFCGPEDVATDTAGNVYVADYGNHTIRMVTPGGVVTTVAGLAGSSGSANGTGSAARFNGPTGVGTDTAGNVYVGDENNHTIRKVTPGGVVTTLAGLAGSFGSADGTGSAARFDNPKGVVADSAGNVYVADGANATIRKVTPGGVVTTLAGLAGSSGSADGTGGAARFFFPTGVATDPTGTLLYIADPGNNAIRLVSPALADVAIIDVPGGPMGVLRQLDVAPQTAVSWEWVVIRRPGDTNVALSSPSIQNPTFTPDAPDLFEFRLDAADAAGVKSITTVQFAASCPSSPPSAPTLLSAAEGCATIDLAWTASAGAGGYNVYRVEGVCGGSYVQIAWGIAGTSYSDTTAIPGISYGYLVRAYEGHPSCESVDSNCITGTVAIFYGDLNEDTLINSSDSVIFSNFLVGNLAQGLPPFTAPLGAADLNTDTFVNAVDAVTLANYLVGNITCLPN